jgi:hypothetical protein
VCSICPLPFALLLQVTSLVACCSSCATRHCSWVWATLCSKSTGPSACQQWLASTGVLCVEGGGGVKGRRGGGVGSATHHFSWVWVTPCSKSTGPSAGQQWLASTGVLCVEGGGGVKGRRGGGGVGSATRHFSWVWVTPCSRSTGPSARVTQ